MESKSCFLIGHRDASSELLPELRVAVRKHICDYGVRTFIVGAYGGFDSLAAKVLAEAKKEYPELVLLLLIPYHPGERTAKTPTGFDSTYYPPNMEKVPRRFAIVQANRYAADSVDYLIAYVWHPASNARELLEYSRRRKRAIITQLACPKKHDSILIKKPRP